MRPTALILGLALLAPTPSTQSAGTFTAGDLFQFSFTGLHRVDPLSGQVDRVVDPFFAPHWNGAACWDPYRKRVLFCAKLGGQPDEYRLHSWDDSGELGTLGLVGRQLVHMAPTGDGRIYLRDATSGAGNTQMRWLDAANRLHVLMDETGTLPFLMPPVPAWPHKAMTYDPITNALFVAGGHSTLAECAGGPSGLALRKLPLSADGSRVVGPITCTVLTDYSNNFSPERFSRGPSGELFLVVSGVGDNILVIDPVTVTHQTWAVATGIAADTGSWSGALGGVAVVDTSSNTLRLFSQGQTGMGTLVPTTLELSPQGTTGESCTLVEVLDDGCAGAWVPYGVGLAGSGGHVPALLGRGCPSPGASPSLVIEDGLGGALGGLMAGLAPDHQPFKDGILLVDPGPVVVAVLLGGPAGVPGAGGIELVPPFGDPSLAGMTVHAQAAFWDPGAVSGVSLTQGLELEIR